jgi:hypothetical protein
VFALSDKQPGFEKVFMHLEKELLTPRYEVHQFSFEKVLLDDFEGEKPVAQRERAARVLLAAAGSVRDKDVRAEFGREAIEAKRLQSVALYSQRLNEKIQTFAHAMSTYYEHHPASPSGFKRDVQSFAEQGNTQSRMIEDPWGNALIGDGQFSSDNSYLILRSMGPDRRDKTADDISFQIYAQRKAQANAARYGSFKGRASVMSDTVAGGRVAVEGNVNDAYGQVIPGVKVSVRRVSNGRTVTVYTDAQGHFTVPNLAPGNYHVVFESDLFQATVYRTLALEAGSRGNIESVLEASSSITPIALTAYLTYSAEFGGMAGDRLKMRKDMARRGGAVGGMADAAAPPMAQPRVPVREPKNESGVLNGR